MDNKRIRYGIRIFTLDRIEQSPSLFIWDEYNFETIVNDEEKHYGLKLISNDKEILLIMEYSNIIWNYEVYFGSYKKRFKTLIKNDERWNKIEMQLTDDLRVMGLETIKEEILTCLKNKEYFEYKNKSKEQFKNYCV